VYAVLLYLMKTRNSWPASWGRCCCGLLDPSYWMHYMCLKC